MMGSGTVLAVARARGHRAIGYDIDPLSVLIASVWTRSIDEAAVSKKAKDVLSRAQVIFGSSDDDYPKNSDDETRRFMRYWFDKKCRRQLTALSQAIDRVRDTAIRDVLWCGFSRLIITKQAGASRALDLSHSRPHRVFASAPQDPFENFLRLVAVVAKNCPARGATGLGPSTITRRGDARKLSLKDSSIDLVLTSPPYLNAIDYLRTSKFSLVWMGYTISELRSIRANSVGSERSTREARETLWIDKLVKDLLGRSTLAHRERSLFAQYALDMSRALAETSRVLINRGRAVYVVGDSNIRGTFVKNSNLLEALAEIHGFSLYSRSERALPPNRRYLPPPARADSGSINSRMRREIILTFKKR
ncbi:MAG TPA: hypothetical protein VN634_07230 [Candidatus Limnocylindrales bacterium]|nr:hypothetical protein [Candidatus Limnocylindrales bacterium]